MAIDFIPRRFYTIGSEEHTLVSRVFVPNCVNDTRFEESSFTDDSESTSERSEVGSPGSPRSLDGNYATSLTRLSSGRNGRLTSDDFVSEQSNQPGGLKMTCEHLSDMVEAEKQFEIFGFCNPRSFNGLVPERFLPSLVEFKDKCARSNRTHDILENSLISTAFSPPDINRPFWQLAGRESRGLQKEGLETSAQGLERESDVRRENRIVVCSNCGCYSWG